MKPTRAIFCFFWSPCLVKTGESPFIMIHQLDSVPCWQKGLTGYLHHPKYQMHVYKYRILHLNYRINFYKYHLEYNIHQVDSCALVAKKTHGQVFSLLLFFLQVIENKILFSAPLTSHLICSVIFPPISIFRHKHYMKGTTIDCFDIVMIFLY